MNRLSFLEWDVCFTKLLLDLNRVGAYNVPVNSWVMSL